MSYLSQRAGRMCRWYHRSNIVQRFRLLWSVNVSPLFDRLRLHSSWTSQVFHQPQSCLHQWISQWLTYLRTFLDVSLWDRSSVLGKERMRENTWWKFLWKSVSRCSLLVNLSLNNRIWAHTEKIQLWACRVSCLLSLCFRYEKQVSIFTFLFVGSTQLY